MAHHCRWCNHESFARGGNQAVHRHEERQHPVEYWEARARHHEVEAALARSKVKGARQRLEQEAAQ